MKKLKKTKQKEISKDQLITILRKPAGLFALISRPKYAFTMCRYDPQENNSYEELSDFYEAVEIPIEQASSDLVPKKKKLIQIWTEVMQVESLNANSLFPILRILIETQPVSTNKNECKRNTLWSQLFLKKEQNQLLSSFNPYWCDALDLLNRAGYKIDNFLRAETESKFICDPFLIYNFTETKPLRRMPNNFRLFILPLLKGNSWRIVRQWLGLYRALELDKEYNLLLTISRMLCIGQEPQIRSWCSKMLECPPIRRNVFATLIIETKSLLKAYPNLADNVVSEFFCITTKKQLPARLYYFFCALKDDISIEYLFAGFRLANRYAPGYHLNNFGNCKSFPFKKVVDLTDWIISKFRWNRNWALSVWEQCGALAGFSEFIDAQPWKKIGIEETFRLINFINAVDVSYPETSVSKQKQLIAKTMPAILKILRTQIHKDYRVKFCNSLRDLAWFELQNIITFIPYYLSILQKVCQPPFDKKRIDVDVLLTFIRFSKKLWPAFLSAPQSSFLCLQKVCSSHNDAFLIERGMRILLGKVPLFAIKCFRHFPGKLFRVAKLLGAFKKPMRIQIVQEFLKLPVMSTTLGKLPIATAAEVIKSELRSGTTNPIPKALRKFLNGEYKLTQNRILRYQRIMFENFNLTRLEILEQHMNDSLAKRYSLPASDESLNHAFQLSQIIYSNRRQLRRFLQHYLNGDQDYVVNHPRTKAWTLSHSDLNLNLWKQGIPFVKTVPDLGQISIHVERSPFEKLKMGTYVGSCLGLGGVNAYSAAAVMLDINKQVLYARNQQGRVLARQLIALSEENKLVCFSVYPLGASKEMKRLFNLYDRTFAKQLSVPILRDRSNYTIKNILSQKWYDDDAWNLKAE